MSSKTFLILVVVVISLAASLAFNFAVVGFPSKAAEIPVPTLGLPANGATGVSLNPTFTWMGVGVDGYGINVSTSSDFSSNVFINGTAQTSYTLTSEKLLPNTKYYWRICGVKAGVNGSWSATWSFTTAAAGGLQELPTPTLISPTNGAIDVSVNPTLTWTAVMGASFYIMSLSPSPDFDSNVLIDSASTNSHKLTSKNLTANAKYYWRVRANSLTRPASPWSTVWSFTTVAGGGVAPAPVLPAPILPAPQQ